MSLSVIPISMKAYVTATATSGDDTLYQLVFHKNTEDEEIIDGVVAIYTAEDLQIPALSTQRYYGVYFNPIIDDDNLIFKAAYGGYKYTAIVADDDTDILSGNTPMIFSNDEVEPRLLPVPTDEDVGKVPTVQEDGSYALEMPEEGVQELDDLTDVDITEPTDGQILKYNATTQKWENETPESGYDEEAHTITINNFNPNSPNSASISFNADKFINANKSITKVNLNTADNKIDFSSVEAECAPSEGVGVYIANDTKVRFNNTLNRNTIGRTNLSFSIYNYSDNYLSLRCNSLITEPIRMTYYKENASSASTTGKQSYNNGWVTGSGWTCQEILINGNQTISLSLALWLASQSDFVIPDVSSYLIKFNFKFNNITYNCAITIVKSNETWTIQSKSISVVNTIPNAPSADGTYALQVTVASGTPTYSWVSTT